MTTSLTRSEVLAVLRRVAALLQPHNDKGDGTTPVFGINDTLLTVGDLRNVRTAIALIERDAKALELARWFADNVRHEGDCAKSVFNLMSACTCMHAAKLAELEALK